MLRFRAEGAAAMSGVGSFVVILGSSDRADMFFKAGRSSGSLSGVSAASMEEGFCLHTCSSTSMRIMFLTPSFSKGAL